MKSSGIGPPFAALFCVAQCARKSCRYCEAFPCGPGPVVAGPPTRACGNRLAYARDRVIVKLVVLVFGSFPVVLPVGLVPHLPIPGGNRLHAIALDHVRGYLTIQLLPSLVVFRRKRPAFHLPWLERPSDVVRIGMGGKRLGHKAELHHRAHMGGGIRIENLVEDGPAIDRVPVRILGVDVGRAPFEIGLAVARGEQEVGPNIDRNRAQIVQLAKQRLAIWRGCVTGLVVAKPAVDGREFTRGFRQVHVDMNRALRPGDRRSQHKAEQGTIAKPSQLGEAHPGRSYLVHDKQATPFARRGSCSLHLTGCTL